jgi:hypothetical protein
VAYWHVPLQKGIQREAIIKIMEERRIEGGNGKKQKVLRGIVRQSKSQGYFTTDGLPPISSSW